MTRAVRLFDDEPYGHAATTSSPSRSSWEKPLQSGRGKGSETSKRRSMAHGLHALTAPSRERYGISFIFVIGKTNSAMRAKKENGHP